MSVAQRADCSREQEPQIWSPSKMIHRLGREIDNPNSVFYWCAKNDIPGEARRPLECVRGDPTFTHTVTSFLPGHYGWFAG